MRYRAVACFLLQVVLIIGHLQTSLNFYHGDYKLENIFVKRSNPQKVKTFILQIINSINVLNFLFLLRFQKFFCGFQRRIPMKISYKHEHEQL